MGVYTPVSGDVVLPGAKATTEWYSRVGGAVAGCGEAAAAVLLGYAKGDTSYFDPNRVTSLIVDAVKAHQTVGMWASSGQASPDTLTYLAKQNGVQTTTFDGSQHRQVLTSYAGNRPVVVGVSNATAFGGTDSSVHGHWITVVGRTHDGNYVVSDPNTPASANGQFVTYTQAQMDAASPFALIVPSQGGGGFRDLGALTQAAQGGGSKHSVSLFPGNTTNLDPVVGFAERAALVGMGVLLLVLGVWLLSRTVPAIGQPMQAAGEKFGGGWKAAQSMAIKAALL